MNRNRAFTLAEIIVVIALLGVVAAIIIPSTVKNYKKREFETRFKIAYKTLNDLVGRSDIENGQAPPLVNNTQEADRNYNTYYRPYLNIIKECPTGMQQGKDRCFAGPNGGWYTMDNQLMESCSGYGSCHYYKAILKNGMSIAISDNKYWRRHNFIFIDINGPLKGYSKLGQDVFLYKWEPASGAKRSELIPVRGWGQVGTCTALTKAQMDLYKSDKYKDSWDNILVPYMNENGYSWDGNHNKITRPALKNAGWSDAEINTYIQISNRYSVGYNAGTNCASDIIRNRFKIPSNYPWKYAQQEPTNFTPLK